MHEILGINFYWCFKILTLSDRPLYRSKYNRTSEILILSLMRFIRGYIGTNSIYLVIFYIALCVVTGRYTVCEKMKVKCVNNNFHKIQRPSALSTNRNKYDIK